MKAYSLSAIGDPPRMVEADDPTPGAGEVLIDIAACGLNFADLLMIEGKYQQMPPPPFSLGMEFAGTVIGHGEGVTAPALGTRVAVMAGFGGLAEIAAVPAGACVPIPDAMPFDDAAAFQVAYGTSHIGLDRRARLQTGETLLVLGAAGGVGLTAIEVGKLMGATVIASARGAEKLAICKNAGADHLIDSDTADIRNLSSTRWGGAITAALFISAFVDNTPWAHVDIAGPASISKKGPYCGVGGTGFGVRLLCDLIENWKPLS